MASRFQIPLYKLFIVTAIFAMFFWVRKFNGQDAVGYTVLAAFAGTIVSVYILFHGIRVVTIGVLALMGAILGFCFAQPPRYGNPQFDAQAFIGAAIGAAIGVLAGFWVASRNKVPGRQENPDRQTPRQEFDAREGIW